MQDSGPYRRVLCFHQICFLSIPITSFEILPRAKIGDAGHLEGALPTPALIKRNMRRSLAVCLSRHSPFADSLVQWMDALWKAPCEATWGPEEAPPPGYPALKKVVL